jgi:hypothetical protein
MAKTTITKILLRRGSDYDRKPTVLDEGEAGWTTDTCRMFVGDGRLPGGFPIVNIRTLANAPGHPFNNDLIYQPIGDMTGTSHPPTQEILAINHPGLSASLTREWMDDRFVLKDPCQSNSLTNPPDPVICAPGSGKLPWQVMRAHLRIMGDLIVHGSAHFLNGITVSGMADFCEATIKADDIQSCDSGTIDVAVDERVKFTGKSISFPTGDSSERPSPAITGDVRFNTELKKFEGFDGITWGGVGGETKTYYIGTDDVKETIGAGAAAVGRQIALTPDMLDLGVLQSDNANALPVYVIKLVHNLNTLYPVVTIFDDRRRQVIPDEIWSLDEGSVLVDLTSYLDPIAATPYSLSTTGPGHTIASSGWVPAVHTAPSGAIQTTAPDPTKKWVATVQG